MSWRRLTDGVLFQAVLTGSLSFSHIHDLAAAHGQAGWKAWLYPLSVDLLTVAAYRKLMAAHRAGAPTGLAWCAFLLGLGASLAANIAAAWENPDRLVAVALGVWPAVAFLVCTLLSHDPVPAAQPALPGQQQVALPVAETAPVPAVAPVGVPAATSATPATAQANPVAPKTRVAAASATRKQAATPTPAADGRSWDALVAAAREVDTRTRQATGRAAGVSKIKQEVGVGQAKAQQLRDHLKGLPHPIEYANGHNLVEAAG